MKTKTTILALLIFTCFAAWAAVPLRWTVETSRLQPVVFDVVRGETLALEARFNSYGTPLATSNMTATLCWQTNGMASAWWVTNAVTTGTSAAALFTPSMDPGAASVTAFIGLTSTNQSPTTNHQSPTTNHQSPTTNPSSLSYRAAFTLRFRHGPGERPNALPLPQKVIDCAQVTFLHPESAPFGGGGGPGGTDTNAVNDLVRSYDETNLTARINAKQDALADYTTTNDVRAIAASAAVTNGGAKAYADATFSRLTTNDVCNIVTNDVKRWVFSNGIVTNLYFGWDSDYSSGVWSTINGWNGSTSPPVLPVYYRIIYSQSDSNLTHMALNYSDDGTLGHENYCTADLRNVNALGLAYRRDVPTTNGLVTAHGATNAAVAVVTPVSNRVDYLDGYIAGQRVRVCVTNYYGNTSGQLPRLRVEEFVTATNVVDGVETETNYWQVVWDEQHKYDRFMTEATTAIAAMTNNLYHTYYALLQERLATKAPRAWGTLTSAGEAAPPGTVWQTEPNTVFAGGTEYAHAMVGTGVIGVLSSKGAEVYTDGETGRFHFMTDDKTSFFGMNISTRYELGCATDGITVTDVGGNNMVDLLYNVTMTGKPVLYYKTNLVQSAWEQITDSAGGSIPGATVYATWDTSPPAGSEICTINCGQGISGYFKATIEYAGVSKFETNMMADLAGGIVATNQTSGQSQPVEPYITNGSVMWRVKQ